MVISGQRLVSVLAPVWEKWRWVVLFFVYYLTFDFWHKCQVLQVVFLPKYSQGFIASNVIQELNPTHLSNE